MAGPITVQVHVEYFPAFHGIEKLLNEALKTSISYNEALAVFHNKTVKHYHRKMKWISDEK
jgi:hypothetical protein